MRSKWLKEPHLLLLTTGLQSRTILARPSPSLTNLALVPYRSRTLRRSSCSRQKTSSRPNQIRNPLETPSRISKPLPSASLPNVCGILTLPHQARRTLPSAKRKPKTSRAIDVLPNGQSHQSCSVQTYLATRRPDQRPQRPCPNPHRTSSPREPSPRRPLSSSSQWSIILMVIRTMQTLRVWRPSWRQ